MRACDECHQETPVKVYFVVGYGVCPVCYKRIEELREAEKMIADKQSKGESDGD